MKLDYNINEKIQKEWENTLLKIENFGDILLKSSKSQYNRYYQYSKWHSFKLLMLNAKLNHITKSSFLVVKFTLSRLYSWDDLKDINKLINYLFLKTLGQRI